MKKIIFMLCIATISVAITACNTSIPKQEKEQDTEFTAGPPKDTVKKDFSHIVFATKKDTSCGMPLSAGIEDTLQFEGKVYGFCSKSCKEAFVTKLKKENKL